MNEQVKKMAELLRSGATMLQDVCPTCGSPLFRFKDKIFCAKCGALSSKVSDAPMSDDTETVVTKLTSTVLRKLIELDVEVNKTTEFEKLYKLAKVVLTLLKTLELLTRLRTP
jgi:UPF0148 protein